MSLTSGILDAGLAFLALCAMFRPLEMSYPAREGQRFFRPQWVTDLCYMLGQYLFFNGAVFWLLGFTERWVHAVVPIGIRHAIGGFHWLAQAVLVVFLGSSTGVIGRSTGLHYSGVFTRSITAPSTWTGWPHIASTRSIRSTRSSW